MRLSASGVGIKIQDTQPPRYTVRHISFIRSHCILLDGKTYYKYIYGMVHGGNTISELYQKHK